MCVPLHARVQLLFVCQCVVISVRLQIPWCDTVGGIASRSQSRPQPPTPQHSRAPMSPTRVMTGLALSAFAIFASLISGKEI